MSDRVHGFDERQPLQNNWLIMGKQPYFTVKNMAQLISDGAVRKATTYALEHTDEKGIRSSPVI